MIADALRHATDGLGVDPEVAGGATRVALKRRLFLGRQVHAERFPVVANRPMLPREPTMLIVWRVSLPASRPWGRPQGNGLRLRQDAGADRIRSQSQSHCRSCP